MAKVVKLKVVRPVNIEWETLNDIINDLDYNAFKVKNRATTMLHTLKIAELDYNHNNEEKMNASIRKEMYGYSTYESLIYNNIKNDYSSLGFHSEIIPGLIREAGQMYNKVLKDMLKGNGTIPTYKRNQPIPVRSRQIKIINADTIQLNILNLIGGEKHHVKNIGKSVPIQLKVTSKKGHAKIAIERIMSGRYSLNDSKIHKYKKDLYILLTFTDNEVKQVAISKDKVLGVHLGIINAVTMHVSGTPIVNQIAGGEIDAFRKRIEKQRISKRNQLKVASQNRKGHGRETLLAPLETLSKKVDNFKNLTNHRYSKYIVGFAIKNGCGTIQLEDLKGIRKDEAFLATWSYFDLQQKIKYKAEECGIEVKIVKPRYTSQRCYKCGYIDNENRIEKNQFFCKKCGHHSDGDINASKNISNQNIEVIIDKEIKKQKRKQEDL
ncbi:RNA-guided endonuclease TnpB family protein [Macrococcus sp. PK]|uniref:RNA-guided endonuclease TnpB family protein n=1 Tax=Macrococcus sp. PK TaxID=2801919 RepID=UPI001F0F81E0|nr:RNA-guided endonuclease TnpB family protein [Macrococcus sp. PK]